MSEISDNLTTDNKEDIINNNHQLNYTGLLPVLLLIIIVIARISYDCCRGQKTRSPHRRPIYGTRGRPSLPSAEPTIYVSPSNLPPPPKYEALAPPSYDEVVGIHHPFYTPAPLQPITQPITMALAQSSSANNVPRNFTNTGIDNVATIETGPVSASTVITIPENRSVEVSS